MPVSRMGTTRAAPLQLDLKPGDVLTSDRIIDRIIILHPGADPLLGIDKGSERSGETMAIIQFRNLDIRNPVMPQGSSDPVTQTVVK